MDVELTRDAQKLVAASYKIYLEKRKNGLSKTQAKSIEVKDVKEKYFEDMSLSDYKDTVAEVTRAFGATMYLGGSWYLSDSCIVYMETRFKRGLADVVSFLGNLIP